MFNVIMGAKASMMKADYGCISLARRRRQAGGDICEEEKCLTCGWLSAASPRCSAKALKRRQRK